MKKIFSMMLLTAAVMVSAFTSCSKNDDDATSAAKQLSGNYSSTMVFASQGKEIGSQQVTIKITPADANHVNIEIPQITDLNFSASLMGQSIAVDVKEYGSFIIPNVPVLAKNGAVLASDMKSFDDFNFITPEELLSKYPHKFEVFPVAYRLKIANNSLSGDATVQGEVIVMKVDEKFTFAYSFYPAENLVSMGISITGLLNK